MIPDILAHHPAALSEVVDGVRYLWQGGRLHRLVASGSAVWESLDGTVPVSEVIDRVARLYDTPRDVIADDVETFLIDLMHTGLLVPAGDQEPLPATPPSVPIRGPGPPPPGRDRRYSGLHPVGSCAALGFTFDIWTDDLPLRDALRNALVDMVSTRSAAHQYSVTGDEDAGWSIHLDGLGLRWVATRDQAFRQVLWHVNSEALRTDTSHAVVHAGAVAIGGSGVLLPGAINAGKTTLTAGLCMSGAAALSDEFAAVRLDTGVLDPYPRPFNLGSGSWKALELDPARGVTTATSGDGFDLLHIAASQLPGGAVSDPVVPVAIVFCEYIPGRGVELTGVDPQAATQTLVHNCMNMRGQLRGERFATLVRLGLRVPAYRLVSGSLRDAVSTARSVVIAGVSDRGMREQPPPAAT